MTRAELLREARRRLTQTRIDNPSLDARLLLLHALAIDAMDLARAPEAPVSYAAIAALDGMLARRIAGEPVARILGEKEFYGLSFRLSPDTLAPRPETELIVDEALKIFDDEERPFSLLDLGAGSGCILLAILHQRPMGRGVAVDRALGAMRTARDNAARLGLDAQARFVVSDWGSCLAGGFDLVVSNPPYIATGEIAGLPREVARHDPLLALDGGADGMDAYRAILSDLDRLLRPDGVAIFEIGHDQGVAIATLAAAHGLACEPVRRDLAGRDRVAILRRSGL